MKKYLWAVMAVLFVSGNASGFRDIDKSTHSFLSDLREAGGSDDEFLDDEEEEVKEDEIDATEAAGDKEEVKEELREALEELGLDYKLNEGDGAFYGPKIDFHLKDCIGRTWQCGTIQLDMQLPQRFDLNYIGNDGEKHRPIVIHRVAFGSIERFIGILIEHYAGRFPTWLAPVQVKILPISDRQLDYCKELQAELKKNNIKVQLDDRSEKIQTIFESFGISLEKGEVSVGSNVTQYEFVPSSGTKLSKIKGLEDDIALHLGVAGLRILAPIRGKSVIGVEVPNIKSNIVGLKGVLTADKDKIAKMDLPISLGETATGKPFTFDLTKAPHVLVGGATGQGKSVGINVMLSSLLFNTAPSNLKFMLVDVKKVELDVYNQISEQYQSDFTNRLVYTETDEIVENLNNVVSEMDTRYDLLKDAKCRNIKEYNEKCAEGGLSFNDGHAHLPYIVVVIDEFADLMMTVGKDVEFPITRLAQLSRAVGIHLIVATQRPSATVITGNITVNFTTRIAFRVASGIDSRTILDSGGAENLIGRGDLLYSSGMDLERIQCALVDTDEVDRIVEYISTQKSGDNIW